MAGRTSKRKASEELTPNSIAVRQPIPSPPSVNKEVMAMNTWAAICTMFKVLWSRLTARQTDIVYEEPAVVAENHVQSVERRKDGTSSLKRQKTHQPQSTSPSRPQHKLRKSRSAAEARSRSGRGFADIDGITDEQKARRLLDDFWSPPELEQLALGDRKRKNSHEDDTSSPSASGTDRDSKRPRHSDPQDNSLRSNPSQPIARLPLTTTPFYNVIRRVPPRRVRTTTTLQEELDRLLLGIEDNEIARLVPSVKKEAEERDKAVQRKIQEEEAARKAEEQKKAAESKAAKERRLHRRYPLAPLVQPLDSKWDNIVNAARHSAATQVITKSFEGTGLRKKDFESLLGEKAWLNDEIINSWILWVVDAANKAAVDEAKAVGEEPTTVPKFIAHNSFFWENLRNKGPSSTERLMKRKKAPGASLLEVDSIFVPICSGSHWTIGVVRPIAKTIEYFDSFGGSSAKFTRVMREWLKFQLKDLYVESEWTVPNTGCARQSNGWDCGVFVCTNAFCVALGLDTSCYVQDDMGLQRKRIAALLINQGFIGDFAWGQDGLLP